MEKLTAAVLNKKHGAIIMIGAHVRVPFGWYLLVDAMLAKLADLPTEVRAFLIVQGIAIDADGLLSVSIAAATDLISSEGWAQVEAIVSEARSAAAWTCVKDRREAWIVSPPRGRPRPLCRECQQEAGLKPVCHAV
jgi:hypothetical protein